MKNKSVKSFLTIFFVIAISASFSFAQNMYSMKVDHEHMHKMDMKNDSSQTMKKDTPKNSIVREGVIDLKAIDANKDGKVYQDVMDYNVISDKPGKCPLCGMTLKEVTLKKAKETLLKSGFNVNG